MGWFHAKKSNPGVTPDFTGLQLQTSVNTLPLAIVWGQSKIAPNVIWYSNFQTQTQTENSGGKGFFRTSSTSGNTYTADLILALCEGPIAGIGQIWKDQAIYTLGSLGLSLFTGTTPQGVWGYLAANDPAQALAYQGTAYVCAASYALGSNAEISNHNFEVEGVLHASGVNGVSAISLCRMLSSFATRPFSASRNKSSGFCEHFFSSKLPCALRANCFRAFTPIACRSAKLSGLFISAFSPS